jgi:hypothetical protein
MKPFSKILKNPYKPRKNLEKKNPQKFEISKITYTFLEWYILVSCYVEFNLKISISTIGVFPTQNTVCTLHKGLKESLSFALYVIRQTANARQSGKMLRYQAIKRKWTCCFKTEIHNYCFDAKKKIWNENVQRKFCQESSNLPFAVPGNVKLKLPTFTANRKQQTLIAFENKAYNFDSLKVANSCSDFSAQVALLTSSS